MITETFDPNTEEILKASDIPHDAGGPGNSPGKEVFPDTVIETFSPKVEKLVCEKYGGQNIGYMNAGVRVPIYEIEIPEELLPAGTEGKAPRRAAVFRTGMGAPFASAMMEELIARGGRKFVVFGSCGVLDGSLAAGHFIVPTEAYRDEGTSYHYAPAADYIRIKNAESVDSALNALEIPHVCGRIWTTDGLYRETRGNAAARLKDGCIAVDMECAALQAVCDLRGCELYQFVYAEDSLDGESWQPRSLGKVSYDEMEVHFRAAMALAARV